MNSPRHEAYGNKMAASNRGSAQGWTWDYGNGIFGGMDELRLQHHIKIVCMVTSWGDLLAARLQSREPYLFTNLSGSSNLYQKRTLNLHVTFCCVV